LGKGGKKKIRKRMKRRNEKEEENLKFLLRGKEGKIQLRKKKELYNGRTTINESQK
jgi:hypothetical protein